MSNRSGKKQTGKVNYIWVLAGGYLVYLAYKIFRTFLAGDSDEPLLAIAAVIVFVAVGGFVLLREWKAYKYGVEHINDPSSWNDEAEDEELAQLMENSKSTALEAESLGDAEERAEDEA